MADATEQAREQEAIDAEVAKRADGDMRDGEDDEAEA